LERLLRPACTPKTSPTGCADADADTGGRIDRRTAQKSSNVEEGSETTIARGDREPADEPRAHIKSPNCNYGNELTDLRA